MKTNHNLVDTLVDRGYIETDRVEKAFRNVDRARFVPEKYQDRAYTDIPLPIEEDATISAPHIVAINTELLGVKESNRVIEIGSGSGYQLAILSQLTNGEVIGVDIKPGLVEKSRLHLSKRENVEVFEGNSFEPVEGKFDRIVYSCAIESFKEARKYLKKNGTAVAPIQTGRNQILKKLEDEELTEHGTVRFVPFLEE